MRPSTVCGSLPCALQQPALFGSAHLSFCNLASTALFVFAWLPGSVLAVRCLIFCWLIIFPASLVWSPLLLIWQVLALVSPLHCPSPCSCLCPQSSCLFSLPELIASAPTLLPPPFRPVAVFCQFVATPVELPPGPLTVPASLFAPAHCHCHFSCAFSFSCFVFFSLLSLPPGESQTLSFVPLVLCFSLSPAFLISPPRSLLERWSRCRSCSFSDASSRHSDKFCHSRAWSHALPFERLLLRAPFQSALSNTSLPHSSFCSFCGSHCAAPLSFCSAFCVLLWLFFFVAVSQPSHRLPLALLSSPSPLSVALRHSGWQSLSLSLSLFRLVFN